MGGQNRSVSLKNRSSCQEVFLGKVIFKYAANLQENTHVEIAKPKLQSNFIEIALRHGWSPVNLLHIFRTTFPRNTCVAASRKTLQHAIKSITIIHVSANFL